MRKLFGVISNFVESALSRPYQLFFIVISVMSISLLVDGTLIEIWTFDREIKRLESDLEKTRNDNQKFRFQIERASHDEIFIERQARQQLDLIKEDELVFLFEQ